MKKTIILIFISLSIFSCKEYLDIKPYGKVIPQTADEFSSLLHTILYEIDNGMLPVLVPSSATIVSFDAITDNLETSLTQLPEGNLLRTYAGDRVGSINMSGGDDYTKYYQLIRNCNIIIGEMKETESELARNVLGTAFAIRGICYYELIRDYCDVYDPLQKSQLGLSIVTVFDMEARPVRSTLKETIEFIEDDLKKALSYNVQEEIYRFTVPVVKGYLARFYFWTRQWEKAANFATQVLDSHPLLDREGYRTMMTPGYALKGNMLIKSELYSTSTEEEAGVGTYKPLQYRPVSKRFIDTFNDEEKAGDIRYEMNFSKIRISTKFIFSGMRSAEMILIRAESYYHLGDEDNALEDINTLRSKRILNYTPLTQNTLPEPISSDYIKQDVNGAPLTKLMALILTERRKELFMEGDRWFELKRNGRPEFWVAQNGLKYTTKKFMYNLPIPLSDIFQIPGLQQNEGYNELIIK